MYLPTPPSSEQKYLYVRQNKLLIYTCGLFSFACLMTGMVLFSLTHEYTIFYALFALIVFVYLAVSYFVGIFSRPFNLDKHKEVVTTYQAYKPSVDVYLPSCGEPLEVLRNTYHHVSHLDWSGVLKVYVLDDSHRADVAELAAQFGYEYVARPNRGELKKAGNIRYAFPRTHGEFVLILDADFCPRPDMLNELVPYFAYDEKIAIVQSPQYFSIKPEHTWVEKGSAYVQELFYRLVQVNRDHWDASVCVGTCAVYRRAALEPHGGTYAIAYSEDLHTGWQATVDGWKVRYVPVNLSKGVCPDTMAAFFVQQTRWCTGSTSLFFSLKFWRQPLGFMQRLCYMSGMFYYVATAASVFLTPLPALVVVWFFPERVFWYNYLFSLPSFVFGVIVLALWSKAPFGAYVLSARQISYYAHFYALYDKFLGQVISWVPTGDNARAKAVGRYQDFKSMLFWWTSATTLLGVGGAFFHMSDLGDVNFYPMLFFTAFNYWMSISALRREA